MIGDSIWVVYAGSVALAMGLGAMFWMAVASGPSARLVRSNLNRGIAVSEGRETRPDPRRGRMGSLIAHPALTRGLDRLLAQSGRPAEWPLGRLLDIKLLVAIVFGLLGTLMLWRSMSPTSVLIVLGLVAGGFFLPDLLLYNTGMKRRQTISLELPDTLDQMSIAVEAGLGFDAAMARVARNGTGILAQELVRTLQDIQVGQPRRVAFEGLAARAAVPELRRFIRSIIRAEEYGMALSDVLNIQAREMRVARRQRAEHKAMQIPVKVTMPLILLILPALFIVVLGPAVVDIMQAFS